MLVVVEALEKKVQGRKSMYLKKEEEKARGKEESGEGGEDKK